MALDDQIIATHCEDATKVLEEELVIHGVQGSSWLIKLTHYDIIRGTAMDYMHCMLHGAVKLCMSLWFDTAHNHER